MGFPVENPVFSFLYWLLNTPGLGALTVALLGCGLITIFGLTLRWVAQGNKMPEREEFRYPTAGLHGHEEG